jgi:cellulose synthase/poly-beta-1,6-N-acetylglucosamine synthase-like glycosyltransferase
MVDSFIEHFLPAICFGYPFVMAWYWMSGGLLYRWIRGRHEPLYDAPVALVEYPSVSILVPCHNEEAQAEETFGILAAIDYPDFEIVAINDGSTDRTAEIRTTHSASPTCASFTSNKTRASQRRSVSARCWQRAKSSSVRMGTRCLIVTRSSGLSVAFRAMRESAG